MGTIVGTRMLKSVSEGLFLHLYRGILTLVALFLLFWHGFLAT